ncbi:MAG TPA: ABC transporter ATP-binding protein [Epulopiscium sp.]|nr:ABC transporter ATP-binding protein [Candidatus Epulonipiscium sp.]
MVVQAKDVEVSFKKENQKRIFGKERQQVLKRVDLSLYKGECVGVVGESGSGKSTFGHVLTGFLKPDTGRVTIDGIDLYGTHFKEEKKILRNKISIVFQDYTSSVNPRFSVRDTIYESLRIKGHKKNSQTDEQIHNLLMQVGLSIDLMNRYPHELSGGQLQRVCIARAIALEPEVILFDEAVSSLDISTQIQVMDLLIDLKYKYDLSYIFITHDLTSITYLCDRVLFLNKGIVVEKSRAVDCYLNYSLNNAI